MGNAVFAAVITLIATVAAAFLLGWMGSGLVAGVAIAVMGGIIIAAIDRNGNNNDGEN